MSEDTATKGTQEGRGSSAGEPPRERTMAGVKQTSRTKVRPESKHEVEFRFELVTIGALDSLAWPRKSPTGVATSEKYVYPFYPSPAPHIYERLRMGGIDLVEVDLGHGVWAPAISMGQRWSPDQTEVLVPEVFIETERGVGLPRRQPWGWWSAQQLGEGLRAKDEELRPATGDNLILLRKVRRALVGLAIRRVRDRAHDRMRDADFWRSCQACNRRRRKSWEQAKPIVLDWARAFEDATHSTV